MSSLSASRIETFEKLLATAPHDSRLRYMLANEYLKAGRHDDAIAQLQSYLSTADDPGAGYGMLAQAFVKAGRIDEAREVYQDGIAAANSHHHPSMAMEFEEALSGLE